MRELELLLYSLRSEYDAYREEQEELDGELRNYMTGKIAGMTKAIALVEYHISRKVARRRAR